MRKLFFGFIVLFLSSCNTLKLDYDYLSALNKDFKKSFNIEQKNNWHNLDIKIDSIPGMSVERAYSELLHGKTGKKVIVAVIDAGIDNLNSNKSSLDRVFMIENYHKLYSEFSGSKADAVQMFLKKIRHALKPGGLVIVIDHDAEKGSSIATASSINRLSDEIVMSDMKNAGFEFVDNIHILKDDWEDDLTISAFDPSVIGSTSRFVHKYRSPN